MSIERIALAAVEFRTPHLGRYSFAGPDVAYLPGLGVIEIDRTWIPVADVREMSPMEQHERVQPVGPEPVASRAGKPKPSR